MEFVFDIENNNITGEICGDEQEFPQISVSKCEIIKGSRIGKGRFGTVFAGTMRDKNVAIKEIFQNELKRTEIDMLQNVRHKNIVHYFGCFKNDRQQFCIIMENADNGDLHSVLHPRKERKFELSMTLKEQWIYEIACGLNYLHHELDNPILHGDIKSPNVLIFKGPRYAAKLTDFGLSEELLTGTYEMQGGLSARWSAPEAVKGKRTTMSDVWSYGSLVWEILMEDYPYDDLDNETAIMFAIGNGKSPFDPGTDDIAEKYSLLLESCFRTNYKDRWKFKEILRYLDDDMRPKSDGDRMKSQSCVSELESYNKTAKEIYQIITCKFGKLMSDKPELLKKVKYMFRDEFPRGARERIKDGYQMVEKLETRGLLSSDNLEIVSKRFRSHGEVELAVLFDEKCTIFEYGSDRDDYFVPPCYSSNEETNHGDCPITEALMSSDQVERNERAWEVNKLLTDSDHVGKTRMVGEMDTSEMDASEKSVKAMSGNMDSSNQQIGSMFTADTMSMEYLFDKVSERVGKENFWSLGRQLLGIDDYTSELQYILQQTTDQRQRTLFLLELWRKRLLKMNKDPTCETLVANLRAAKLQRTASDIEKILPCPQ